MSPVAWAGEYCAPAAPPAVQCKQTKERSRIKNRGKSPPVNHQKSALPRSACLKPVLLPARTNRHLTQPLRHPPVRTPIHPLRHPPVRTPIHPLRHLPARMPIHPRPPMCSLVAINVPAALTQVPAALPRPQARNGNHCPRHFLIRTMINGTNGGNHRDQQTGATDNQCLVPSFRQ